MYFSWWPFCIPDCNGINIPEHCENVSGTGGILATVEACPKLTNGLQEIHVVAANKVLGQIDDCAHKRGLQGKQG